MRRGGGRGSALGALAAVARALGIGLGRSDAVEQIGAALAARGPLVFVLDNLEQIARVIAPLITRWLTLAPELRVLATSRSVLGGVDEQIHQVLPLPFTAALQMFVLRARPGFSLTLENRGVVARLVRSLDRLPLALELAAACLNILSVGELERRLGQRLELLRDGLRDPQQRALRGALDQSWALLDDAHRSALSQCSVFRGGFDLSAAEGVLAGFDGSGPDAPPVIDVLTSLCADHLLRREDAPSGGGRYALLESIRVYAASHLDDPESARRRHSGYYARLGTAEQIRALHSAQGPEHRTKLEKELENLAAGARRGSGVDAVRCGCAALSVFLLRGPMAAGIALATEVLAGGERDADRARLLRLLAELQRLSGQSEAARRSYLRGLDSLGPEGDEICRANTMGGMGLLEHTDGELDAAETWFRGALALHRRAGNRLGEGIMERALGVLCHDTGDQADCEAHMLRGLAIQQEIGSRWQEGVLRSNLANYYRGWGRVAEALEQYAEALLAQREVGDQRGEGITLGNLGNLYNERGDLERADAHYAAAKEIHRAVGNRLSEAVAEINQAQVALKRGQLDTALERANAACAMTRGLDEPVMEAVFQIVLAEVQRAHGELDAARSSLSGALDFFLRRGLTRYEASALAALGEVALAAGEFQEAANLLGRAETRLREDERPLALALVRCAQGRLAMSLGEDPRPMRDEARQIAAALEASPESELGLALAAFPTPALSTPALPTTRD